MPKNIVKELERLATIRQAIAPALIAGVALTTSTGLPVTPDNIAQHMTTGAAINLIDSNGRLAGVTFVDEDVCAYSNTPSFCQIDATGSKTRFYFWPGDFQPIAADGYQPAPLRLSDPLFAVKLDKSGDLLRTSSVRAAKLFRDRFGRVKTKIPPQGEALRRE